MRVFRYLHLCGVFLFLKRVMIPKIIMTPPEMVVQTNSGTLINIVLTFNKNVNTKTETPKETITIHAFLLLNTPEEREPPTITGRRGKIHGVSAVISPAKNEISNSVIASGYF